METATLFPFQIKSATLRFDKTKLTVNFDFAKLVSNFLFVVIILRQFLCYNFNRQVARCFAKDLICKVRVSSNYERLAIEDHGFEFRLSHSPVDACDAIAQGSKSLADNIYTFLQFTVSVINCRKDEKK